MRRWFNSGRGHHPSAEDPADEVPLAGPRRPCSQRNRKVEIVRRSGIDAAPDGRTRNHANSPAVVCHGLWKTSRATELP